MKKELNALTAHELLDKIKQGEISGQDIVNSLQKRIDKIDYSLNAYVRKSNGKVAQRDQADKNQGIPVSIKDNISTEGYPTECCSKILAGFIPPFDATVITKIKESGNSFFDKKTNMDEFAFGSSTENSCFGVTRNPWNLDYVSGGSSGGSAAAVAADTAIWALGSDTGGSIRQPSAFCGVVGLKPTYGRVSRHGLIAFASSLDQIGPITKDVHDCALLLKIISGQDTKDSTSVNLPVPDYLKALGKDIQGFKVAYPKKYFAKYLDSEISSCIKEAIEKLKEMGVIFKEVSMPHVDYAAAAYYIIATAEASSSMAKFDGVRYGLQSKSENIIDMYKKTRAEGFGTEAKRRIILGTLFLSHKYYEDYYLRALKVRTLIKNDFDKLFKDFDCVLSPTFPNLTFKVGEKSSDPLKKYFADIYTISANLTGIPAISLPCGFTKNGLPVGLQILANHFDEEKIFSLAFAYEQKTKWYKIKPNLK